MSKPQQIVQRWSMRDDLLRRSLTFACESQAPAVEPKGSTDHSMSRMAEESGSRTHQGSSDDPRQIWSL